MKVEILPLNLIIEDKEQPRSTFLTESLEDLKESITQVGLLNPIKVRILQDGTYKIIFGNRRYLACKSLGMSEIPCIVSETQDELEIYLEQLAENIQREGFTPVEEAIAFQKLLENSKFQISKKLLSSRLGKTESYISRKLDLLVFGTKVRNLIHSSKDIVEGLLTEEQALKLKKLPIEYRDAVAIKIAQESVNVLDTGKIAELFIEKSISPTIKEKLLEMPAVHMVTVWAEHKIGQTRVTKKETQETLVPKAVIPGDDLRNTLEEKVEDYILKFSPLQEKVNTLNAKIPIYYPMEMDLLEALSKMDIDARDELRSSVGILISTLEGHLKDWKLVQMMMDEETKNTIKLVKG